MGQIASSRIALIASLLGSIVIASASGCGSATENGKGNPSAGSDAGGSGGDGGASSESGAPNEEGGADNSSGGRRATGGATGSSGGRRSAGGAGGASPSAGAGGSIPGVGGFGGIGGGFGGVGGFGHAGTSGFSGGGSGGPSCVEGVPCTCDDDLVGVTECSEEEEEASCACPPAKECAPDEPESCFEPCGGEPFGTWVLEDACLAGNGLSSCTSGVLRGTPGEMDLRLRILDGGQLEIRGSESWDIAATVQLSCLGISTVNACSRAELYSDALLFSGWSNSTPCEANACGVCDCSGTLDAGVDGAFSYWSRQGTDLFFDNSYRVPYCVDGDELWLGGSSDGGTRVSYKFKKQSCAGTPIPCSERSADECDVDGYCSVGRCQAQTGTVPSCAKAFTETECGVLQGCTWDPEGCSGQAPSSCDFETCGAVPGCAWGEPKARCGGEPTPCEGLEVADCGTPGCSVRVCGPNFGDISDCQVLTAAECAQAPGCTVSGTSCTGQALCAAQSDASICSKLVGCVPYSYCYGVPTRACSALTVEECPTQLGCRIEW